MFTSCLEKQNKIKTLFESCDSAEEKYQLLIQLGKMLAKYPEKRKTREHSVSGCQSLMYLHGSCTHGVMHFEACSEALISAGMASVLIQVYDQEPPEALFKCPPNFLEELGIGSLLSPGRSQGLASLFLRMQQLAAQSIASSVFH